MYQIGFRPYKMKLMLNDCGILKDIKNKKIKQSNSYKFKMKLVQETYIYILHQLSF